MDREQDLIARYKAIYEAEGPPDWAFKEVPPTIPFIGRRYEVHGDLLVYASAENLAGYGEDYRDSPVETAPWNRARRHFDQWQRDRHQFFPEVHIQPVSDGGLQVAAAFIRHRLGRGDGRDTEEAVEASCFANFAKFAVRAKGNRDYAGSGPMLAASLPYVKADLEVLDPRRILMPRTIWAAIEAHVRRTVDLRDRFKTTIDRLENAGLFTVQCNMRAVNTLKRRKRDREALDRRAAELRAELEGGSRPSWLGWMDRMRAMNKDRFWYYLAEVDLELDAGRRRGGAS